MRYRDLFDSRRIVWLCRAGHYSAGMTPLCPIGIVACMDDSPTHDLIQERDGVRFFSLEKTRGRMRDDSTLNEVVPCVREELEAALGEESGDRWVFAAASPSRSLADFASETGYALFANPPELTAWLNDKVNVLAALDDLGLPRIRGRWGRLTEMRYLETASEMGTSFVVQLARGTAGSGTAFIGSEQDHAAAGARFGVAPVWVTPDLGDLSVNINAIAMEDGVVVSCPSVQLAGLSMLCSQRGMYCGNDFVAARDLPAATVGDVVEQTASIGRWLASLGFRGLYGLDFVLDTSSSKAYAVDLNPRWQGSTAPLTLAEYKAGRLPLAVADMAWRMGALGETEVLCLQDEFIRPVRASHISLRCRASGWSEVAGNLRPGVYSRDLAFVRPGLRLNDLERPDEILVTGGVPRPGARMGPKAHALRVASEQQVMDVGRLRPLPWSEAAARILYQALALKPVEEEAAR
jgi:hypothetical protein